MITIKIFHTLLRVLFLKETFSSPVNGIVHPAGLKNFADVGITSEASTRAGLAGTTNSITILDVVNEKES